jgi:hypothetical protein
MKEWRLKFIDVMLEEYGTVNRSAIERFFDLSTPQASLDIRAYIEAAPDNMEYDRVAKCYRRTATFSRKYP